MTRLYVYPTNDDGTPGCAVALREGATPTDADVIALQSCGLRLARSGRRYRKVVACPVNGDGYWYWRRELLAHDGTVIGSRWDGHGGEL